MMNFDEEQRWGVDGVSDDESSFRCPHCDLFFGWTDGRSLRTRAIIFNERMEMQCVGCGESYVWSPTTEAEG